MIGIPPLARPARKRFFSSCSFRLSGAFIIGALSLTAMPAAHARMGATAEITDIRYSVFSIGAPGSTAPGVTFAPGNVEIGGSLSSQGDDGLFWTPAVVLDQTENRQNAQTTGALRFAQDIDLVSARRKSAAR